MVEIRDKEFNGSKKIITVYKVVRVLKENRSLLEIDLITGRTHQIRAHMAHIGHSLIGDGKYGINRDERADGYKYQALYAYKLYFKKSAEKNIFSYLEGKTFKIDESDIWFLKDIEK